MLLFQFHTIEKYKRNIKFIIECVKNNYKKKIFIMLNINETSTGHALYSLSLLQGNNKKTFCPRLDSPFNRGFSTSLETNLSRDRGKQGKLTSLFFILGFN